MPKISIIVPVYNVETYLNRCIDSILNQTFTDFELILVDDGSPDNCGRICNEYADKDQRVIVIHKENGGVSSARNVGMKNAKGEYIMFIDSDDYVDENILYVCEKNLKYNVDMVITSLSIIKKNSKNNLQLKEGLYTSKQLIQSYCNGEFNFLDVPVCKLYNANIIRDNNLCFDENLSLGEDTCFVLSYIKQSNDIIALNESYYYYMNDNDESLVNRIQDNIYEQQLFVYKFAIKLIRSVCVDEQCIDNYIRLKINYFISILFKIAQKSKYEIFSHFMKCAKNDKLFENKLCYIKKVSFKLIAYCILKGKCNIAYIICKSYLFIRNTIFVFKKMRSVKNEN